MWPRAKIKPPDLGLVHIQNTDSILDNEGLRPLWCITFPLVCGCYHEDSRGLNNTFWSIPLRVSPCEIMKLCFFGGVLHKTKLCQAAMAHSRQARSFVLSTQVNSGRQYWNILNPQAKNWQVARGNLLCLFENANPPTTLFFPRFWYRPFKVLVQAV